MLWLNSSREQIKADNPGIKVTEIAKRGGELWRELKDKSVCFWMRIWINLSFSWSSFMLSPFSFRFGKRRQPRIKNVTMKKWNRTSQAIVPVAVVKNARRPSRHHRRRHQHRHRRWPEPVSKAKNTLNRPVAAAMRLPMMKTERNKRYAHRDYSFIYW